MAVEISTASPKASPKATQPEAFLTSRSLMLRVARCDVCGEEVTLPFRCKYCGGNFCTEHRLPENHDCDGLDEYWNVPVNVKKRPSPQPAKKSWNIGLTKYGANNTVLIICTVLFFISFVAPYEMVEIFALHPAVKVLITRPWQLITSMFLHVDFWHFFINMFVLLFFGTELERRLGDRKYLEIFFAAGLAGNIGYIAYSYAVGSFAPALGASAAIFGVMGCLAIIAPEIRIIIFPIPIPINIRTALLLFAAYDFWMMVASYTGVFYTNVANIAHLAGLAVGLYYGKRLGRRKVRYDFYF
jgi:membrane associated rhomboid family serine protease